MRTRTTVLLESHVEDLSRKCQELRAEVERLKARNAELRNQATGLIMNAHPEMTVQDAEKHLQLSIEECQYYDKQDEKQAEERGARSVFEMLVEDFIKELEADE